MVIIQESKRIANIDLQLTNDNAGGGQILTLYKADLAAFKSEVGIATNEKVGFAGYLKSLTVTAIIDSIPETPLPMFEIGESRESKIAKTLDSEWNPNRKQLSFYTRINVSTPWIFRGSVSLVNPANYPYRQYEIHRLLTRNLAAEFGNGRELGVKIDNIGNGYLGSTDEIYISGDISEEGVIGSAGTPGGGGTATADYPSSFTHWHDQSIFTSGSKAIVMDNNQYMQVYTNNNPATSTDAFEFYTQLKAGTYTLNTLGLLVPNGGRMQILVNDNSQGNITFYNATTQYNVIRQVSITTNVNGTQKISGRVNGQPAGSTGYAMPITKFWV